MSHVAAGPSFSLRLFNRVSTPLCFGFFALGFRLFGFFCVHLFDLDSCLPTCHRPHFLFLFIFV